jgi:transposase-like protein
MDALPKTLAEAIRYFANPDNCREYLAARRWPNGVTCPACGSNAVYFDKGRNGWECKTRHPKRKFSLKTGTIFEDSPLGLDKWLPAVWMIGNMRNGVSSHELARSLGVTQKTAWFMLHRIRLAMQDDSGGKLGATSRSTRRSSVARRATRTPTSVSASLAVAEHWARWP